MTAKNTTDKTTATNDTPATTPPAVERFSPLYLHCLASQAHEAVFEWLKGRDVPAHIFDLFQHSMCLASYASDGDAIDHRTQREVDAMVIDTLKALGKAGAPVADALGTWHDALDEVQG